jgi:hypothetical protein
MVEKIRELSESSITIKAAVVIAIFCSLFGVLFSQIYGHETRLSKMEQCVVGIQADAQLTQRIVLAIREDQVAFYRGQNPKWQSTYDYKGEMFKGERP